LLELFVVSLYEQYQQFHQHQGWIKAALKTEENRRITAWTQNLAVDREDYVSNVTLALGGSGSYKTVLAEGDTYTLKEPVTPYVVHLEAKKRVLSDDNTVECKLKQHPREPF
jgi:hypothetical protein